MEIGDIQQEATSPYRQNLIFSMCPQNQWKHRPEIIEEFRNLGKKYNDEFQKLVHLLSLDHPIRIWYSSAPYALCGFYHLCFLLKETDVPISAVNLPPYVIKDNVVLEYANWEKSPLKNSVIFFPMKDQSRSRSFLCFYKLNF